MGVPKGGVVRGGVFGGIESVGLFVVYLLSLVRHGYSGVNGVLTRVVDTLGGSNVFQIGQVARNFVDTTIRTNLRPYGGTNKGGTLSCLTSLTRLQANSGHTSLICGTSVAVRHVPRLVCGTLGRSI